MTHLACELIHTHTHLQFEAFSARRSCSTTSIPPPFSLIRKLLPLCCQWNRGSGEVRKQKKKLFFSSSKRISCPLLSAILSMVWLLLSRWAQEWTTPSSSDPSVFFMLGCIKSQSQITTRLFLMLGILKVKTSSSAWPHESM